MTAFSDFKEIITSEKAAFITKNSNGSILKKVTQDFISGNVTFEQPFGSSRETLGSIHNDVLTFSENVWCLVRGPYAFFSEPTLPSGVLQALRWKVCNPCNSSCPRGGKKNIWQQRFSTYELASEAKNPEGNLTVWDNGESIIGWNPDAGNGYNFVGSIVMQHRLLVGMIVGTQAGRFTGKVIDEYWNWCDGPATVIFENLIFLGPAYISVCEKFRNNAQEQRPRILLGTRKYFADTSRPTGRIRLSQNFLINVLSVDIPRYTMNFLNLDENCQNYCTVTVRYNGLESTSVGTWHSGGEGHSGLLSESDM